MNDNQDYKKYWDKTKAQMIKELKSRIVENGLNSISGEFKIYENIYGLFRKEYLTLTRTGFKRTKVKEYKYEGLLRRTIKDFHVWLDENGFMDCG